MDANLNAETSNSIESHLLFCHRKIFGNSRDSNENLIEIFFPSYSFSPVYLGYVRVASSRLSVSTQRHFDCTLLLALAFSLTTTNGESSEVSVLEGDIGDHGVPY